MKQCDSLKLLLPILRCLPPQAIKIEGAFTIRREQVHHVVFGQIINVSLAVGDGKGDFDKFAAGFAGNADRSNLAGGLGEQRNLFDELATPQGMKFFE